MALSPTMGVAEMLGLAASVSFLSGWRLYLCILAVGAAMHLGWIGLPRHLAAFDVLASTPVLAAATIGLIAEFLADKVPWVDSVWDTVHAVIRPVGGAVLALALVDPSDPAWQAAVLLLGGGAALVAHGAKASTRAVANVSPEPFSNMALSTGEDVASAGLLAFAFANPAMAALVALLVGAGSVWLLLRMRRLAARIGGALRRARPSG